MDTQDYRIVKKHMLFDRIKAKGLFWSYAPDIPYDASKDNLLCETVLKYADIDDIRQLLALYGESKVRDVWERDVKSDARFKRLNYFIARVFFHLDVEACDFENLQHERLAKFRLLAG
jgi:hypothetical protein